MEQNFSECERFQIGVLPAVYGSEFLVALLGNAFAVWLLLTRERGKWHSGSILSFNLAVSDLLYILTLPLLIIYYALGKHWPFGESVCKLERFLFTSNLYGSIFFIMAISMNRCLALVWPFFTRSHVEPFHIKIISGIIWVVVGLISCPVLKFASICPHTNTTLCVSFCDSAPQGVHPSSGPALPHFAYRLFLAVFGCFLPFLVTCAAYCGVGQVVWKNTSLTSLEKRKVALLVSTVIVLYAASFLPYHIFQTYHLYERVYGQRQKGCWVYHMYQVSKGLATLNMCIHPVLYMAVLDSIKVACWGRSSEDKATEIK